MKSHPKPLRRSGANIMANLILLLGSLSYIMVLAVINGSAGFVSAMGVTLFGAVGIAKALGEPVALSYGMIGALAILCGAVRAVLAAGIALVAHDRLSAGRMIIGVTAVFGSFGPVIAISALPGNLTQTFASGDRVLSLLREAPAVTPVENGRTFDFEHLTVNDLSFSYDGQAQVLQDVCMRADSGEIVGIVGESGCGKSTLLKLLLRFWQKDRGTIAYNGIDVDETDTASLLDNVTMVSQSTYLFDDTIEENLRIAKPDATREEMEAACRMASVHECILSLPEGYRTRAGTLGGNLSAGEKQRIGLARAFLRGSGLILLDEPTSNVDSINEGIILAALKEQKRRKSIILVSHRESTMSIAERVYRVEKGRLYEQT